MTIAWGITGAGVYLEESVSIIEKLIGEGRGVTVYVSRAGETVLDMYGLRERIEKTTRRRYPTGVVYESRELPGYPSTGRLYLGVYRIVVVSPASMNTVSKIVHGIADTLISNLVMHAVKTNTPVYIVPVDAFETRSKIPVAIDRNKCSLCGSCGVIGDCPTGALSWDPYYLVKIDLSKCSRCYLCVYGCPLGAIRFNVEIVVKPVSFYLDIVKKLEEIPGVRILEHPSQVLSLLGDRG